jgi:anti-sigma-K factor RskA
MSRVLDDPLLWIEPPPELEQRVIQLIEASAPEEPPATRRPSRWWVMAAAAVLAVAMATGAILFNRQPPADWEITAAGLGPATTAVASISGWNTEAGTRVVVEADALAAAPSGYTYQLWFIKGSEPISAGTFAAADHPIELFVGVARSDYPRIAVTLEPLDGDPAPSGVFVFDDGA